MTTTGHLGAIGYDDVRRAEQVREEVVRLGWGTRHLHLTDVAVVVRRADGSFTFDREPFPAARNVRGCTIAGFLAGLVVGTPLSGVVIGAALGAVGSATMPDSVGI